MTIQKLGSNLKTGLNNLKRNKMAQDLLTYGFYPLLSLLAVVFLYAIGVELEKLNKKK